MYALQPAIPQVQWNQLLFCQTITPKSVPFLLDHNISDTLWPTLVICYDLLGPPYINATEYFYCYVNITDEVMV